jgi:adenylate cyclase
MELEDAPLQACLAARAICGVVEERRADWAALGVPDLRIGVGLETGTAIVGNVGSKRRFDYTALGDVVNVASRLQDLNKTLGTRILVGPGVREAVPADLGWIPHGPHQLRGRPTPISVFELPWENEAP